MLYQLVKKYSDLLQCRKVSRFSKFRKRSSEWQISWDRNKRIARVQYKEMSHLTRWNVIEKSEGNSVLPWRYLEISRKFVWLFYKALPWMSWFPPLSPTAPLIVFQHFRGWGKNSFIVWYLNSVFDQKNMFWKSITIIAEISVLQHANIFIRAPAFWQRFLSNLMNIEYSVKRDGVSYTYDILYNKGDKCT